MKKKIKYTDEPMENVRVIPDFLPSPEELVLKDRTVLVHLDSDILEWFKNRGKDYQSRINAALRMYMNAQSQG